MSAELTADELAKRAMEVYDRDQRFIRELQRERAEARAEVERLQDQLAAARQWIVNCVDPAVVGLNAKQRMLDALAVPGRQETR